MTHKYHFKIFFFTALFLSALVLAAGWVWGLTDLL
ncbi:hypothetical protein LEM8419_03525 [Neolewinella maritima]|uniref:Uncharacterized protein n=1 Tax=Neolewinella maritima TaxID=1383882 RepID=A0ABN8FBD7_9BACT|nr:hypothetical protein LEM8419_03525 [Neolewinella maritima]